jgi:hypothetical protein
MVKGAMVAVLTVARHRYSDAGASGGFPVTERILAVALLAVSGRQAAKSVIGPPRAVEGCSAQRAARRTRGQLTSPASIRRTHAASTTPAKPGTRGSSEEREVAAVHEKTIFRACRIGREGR